MNKKEQGPDGLRNSQSIWIAKDDKEIHSQKNVL